MSARGSWLSTTQINSFLSGTENKATSLCYHVNPQHAHVCLTSCQPPRLRKDGAQRDSSGEQQYGLEKAVVPGPARSEHIGPARACEGESQQALRSSLLWAVEAGSVVLHLPNQGLGDLMQNQQIEGGERSVFSPCTLLSFGFSGHSARQMPKEEEAGGDCLVLRTVQVKTTPSIQEFCVDLQIVGGWEDEGQLLQDAGV